MLIARDGELHVEDGVGDHPGEELEGVGGFGIEGRERRVCEMLFDDGAEGLPAGNGFDLGRLERAADDEAHMAAILDEAFDAAGGEGEGGCGEVAGEAVVTDGGGKRGDVETLDQIAVFGGVFDLPLAVAQQGHAAASFQRSSWCGSRRRSAKASRRSLSSASKSLPAAETAPSRAMPV